MDLLGESQHPLYPTNTLLLQQPSDLGVTSIRMPPLTDPSPFLIPLSSPKPVSCTEHRFASQTSITGKDKNKVYKDRKSSRARPWGFSDKQSRLSPATTSLAKH